MPSINVFSNDPQQPVILRYAIIQCKKDICYCGLCAPKAKNLDTYKSIMKKYQKEYSQ